MKRKGFIFLFEGSKKILKSFNFFNATLECQNIFHAMDL